MKKPTIVIAAIFLSTLSASADDMAKGKVDVKKPIHCPTAEGDIRVLNSEKVHVKKQKVSGIFSITPIGLLTNAVTDQSDAEKLSIEKYDKMLDAKIAEIKKACHIK